MTTEQQHAVIVLPPATGRRTVLLTSQLLRATLMRKSAAFLTAFTLMLCCAPMHNTSVRPVAVLPLNQGDAAMAAVAAEVMAGALSASYNPPVLNLHALRHVLQPEDLASPERAAALFNRLPLDNVCLIEWEADHLLVWQVDGGTVREPLKAEADSLLSASGRQALLDRVCGELNLQNADQPVVIGLTQHRDCLQRLGNALWMQLEQDARQCLMSVEPVSANLAQQAFFQYQYISWLIEAAQQQLADEDQGEAALVKAESAYQQAREILPPGQESLLAGRLFLLRGRLNWAEEALKEAYSHLGPTPDLMFLISRLHPSRWPGLKENTVPALLEDILRRQPLHLPSVLTLGDWYLGQNASDKAEEIYKQYLSYNAGQLDVLTALGRIYVLRNEPVKIIDTYSRAIEIDSTFAEAYYNLGIAYFNSDRLKQASGFFTLGLQMDGSPDNHLYLARIAELQADTAAALLHYRARLQARRGSDDLFANEAAKRLNLLLNGEKSL